MSPRVTPIVSRGRELTGQRSSGLSSYLRDEGSRPNQSLGCDLRFLLGYFPYSWELKSGSPCPPYSLSGAGNVGATRSLGSESLARKTF